MKNKKVLITGGAGFIGSAVVRHIINKTNDIVINVDKLTYAGNLESLESISDSKRYFFEKTDICDKYRMQEIFKKYQPDLIIHLAAESHVDRSIDGPSDFIETNIIGTFHLLETARHYWMQLDESRKDKFRFHHISTDEVFGDLEPLSPAFTEKNAYRPSSPYSSSKAASDHLVRAWHRTYGLPVSITNCSNNYGPFHFPEKLIPLVILNALKGLPLPIYGDGAQIRDWLFVEDHAKAIYLVATTSAVGSTYNIGGHNEKTNLEVVNEICTLLDEYIENKPNDINSFSDLITFVRDRPGHDSRYAIDASKIHQDLGWIPEESFESGIRKTILWYLKNEKWTSRVIDGSYFQERKGIIK